MGLRKAHGTDGPPALTLTLTLTVTLTVTLTLTLTLTLTRPAGTRPSPTRHRGAVRGETPRNEGVKGCVPTGEDGGRAGVL